MSKKKIWKLSSQIPRSIRDMVKTNDPGLYNLMLNKPFDNILFLLQHIIYNKQINTFINLYPLVASDIKNCHELFKYAAQNGSIAITEYLLDGGVDVTFDNNIAIQYISHSLDDASILIQKMINHGADPTINKCKPLKNAVKFGHINNARTLINNGGYIKSSELDAILIYNAIEYDNLEKVKLVIELGIDISLCDEYIINETIISDNANMIRYLLDIGLDPNRGKGIFLKKVIDFWHNYDKNFGFDMMKMLLEYGANIQLLNIDDLIKVIKNRDINALLLLIEYGVDFTKVNNYKSDKSHKIETMINLGIDPVNLAKILA